MYLIPFIYLYGALVLAVGLIGLVLIWIGKAFRWVLLAFAIYLALFEVSLADELHWQLVLIKDGQIIEEGEPYEVRRECIEAGHEYMRDHDLDGFLCDRVLPEVALEIPVCLAPVEQCS